MKLYGYEDRYDVQFRTDFATLAEYPTLVDTTRSYNPWPVCNVGVVQRVLVLVCIGEGENYNTIPQFASCLMKNDKRVELATVEDLIALREQHPEALVENDHVLAPGTARIDGMTVFVPAHAPWERYHDEWGLTRRAADRLCGSVLYLARLRKDT